MMLKVVRKSRVINWHTATCSVFCEGCEREKTKIPVTRAKKDQNEGILAFYTLHPAHCHQLCFVTSPSVQKEGAHNEKSALEISPKTLDFFPKNSHVFLFFSYVFPTFSEKKWCSTFPKDKSKDNNRTPKTTAQNIQSARKDTFFGDYLKFYLCMPIKIYNFAK